MTKQIFFFFAKSSLQKVKLKKLLIQQRGC